MNNSTLKLWKVPKGNEKSKVNKMEKKIKLCFMHWMLPVLVPESLEGRESIVISVTNGISVSPLNSENLCFVFRPKRVQENNFWGKLYRWRVSWEKLSVSPLKKKFYYPFPAGKKINFLRFPVNTEADIPSETLIVK